MRYNGGVNSEAVIRSRANPVLKRIGAALAGKSPGTVVLEGERLVGDALRAGIALEVLLVSDRREGELAEWEGRVSGVCEVRIVEHGLLERVSALAHSPGLLALAPAPDRVELGELEAGSSALVLVAAGVADPGNLGALARSAEAAGATGLVVLEGGASPWHEKSLRGSMGSLLRLPVCHGAGAEEVADFLGGRGFRQVTAATRGGRAPGAADWSGPVAIWVGGETGSLPAVCDGFQKVTIPMAGEVESLNVTVAGALLLFASGRAPRGDG